MKKIYFLLAAFLLFGTLGAQTIFIPNGTFKTKLTVQSTVYGYARDINGHSMIVDTNNDGEIQVSEAQNVYELYVGGSYANSLTGIEYFINLRKLWCENNRLASLDLSALTHLQNLECHHSQVQNLNIVGLAELKDVNIEYNLLTNLNLTGCTALQRLWCNNNQLNTIDIAALTNLNYLRCENNNINSLNASNLVRLNNLQCFNNHMTNLDVSGSVNLRILKCSNNQIANLNVSQLVNLQEIRFADNPISNIDLTGLNQITNIELGGTQINSMNFSQIPLLQSIICYNCPLNTIDVSNNPDFRELVCTDSPLLESVFMKNGRGNNLYATGSGIRYVCADQSEIDNGNIYLPTNAVINSYCTFVPGGIFYTIQGNNKFDSMSNGCDDSDVSLPNLKFDITNGTVNGTVISNASGNYSISVQNGTHTLTPILENPDYFNITPSFLNVTFPTQPSPFAQDFCINANGVHPDLEIILISTVPARPGFDANYKLIYKNKGNQTQSGSVSLTFDDAVLDFVSANPVVTNQTVNNLSWDFANLQPFETREISLTLNVNSPSETPAVNNGDILNYTATITSPATDETPTDNTFTLNQTVINSYDPNDKTCLEGAVIAPSEVGKYVHYMIRFENTGTFPAENIVVKDMIDTNKFDINSLVPIKGSHSFVTNITSGNKVEFIFENINLPFNDANNDGYVAFKIKTKPSLVNGDTFSNSASIYFDYNFPIVTNTATTTIAALSNQDFSFASYFMLYPNPVKDVLNIETKETIEVSSINIYNQLGQLVLVIPNANQTKSVDVSNLSSGNYFIKVNSDKGTSNTKFIKQ